MDAHSSWGGRDDPHDRARRRLCDLLEAEQIPDPFYRDTENELQWIGETDWTYRRTFDVPAALLENEVVTLHCDGLDTFAEIKVNGTRIAPLPASSDLGGSGYLAYSAAARRHPPGAGQRL